MRHYPDTKTTRKYSETRNLQTDAPVNTDAVTPSKAPAAAEQTVVRTP